MTVTMPTRPPALVVVRDIRPSSMALCQSCEQTRATKVVTMLATELLGDATTETCDECVPDSLAGWPELDALADHCDDPACWYCELVAAARPR